MSINIDDIIENLFTPEEFELFNNLKNVNIDSLKQIGDVGQETITENGITKDTVTFNSFDGKHSFTKTNSYFTANALHEKVKELNQQISNAVACEDYLLAAKIKERKDALLCSNN